MRAAVLTLLLLAAPAWAEPVAKIDGPAAPVPPYTTVKLSSANSKGAGFAWLTFSKGISGGQVNGGRDYWFTGPPGEYQVALIVSESNVLATDQIVVTIGLPPPVPPGPGPLPPGPAPADPLAQALAAAYAIEADPAKAAQVQKLAALWRQAGLVTVQDAQFATTATLLPVLHAAADTLVGKDGLPKVRRAVADELNKTLATPLPLDAATRAKLAAQFAHVAAALGGLR